MRVVIEGLETEALARATADRLRRIVPSSLTTSIRPDASIEELKLVDAVAVRLRDTICGIGLDDGELWDVAHGLVTGRRRNE